jgi:hypothetical protein
VEAKSVILFRASQGPITVARPYPPCLSCPLWSVVVGGGRFPDRFHPAGRTRRPREPQRIPPLKTPTGEEAPARASAHTPLKTPTVYEAPARASASNPAGGPAHTPLKTPTISEAPARAGPARSPPGPPTGAGTKIRSYGRDPSPTAKSQTCARGKPGVVWS